MVVVAVIVLLLGPDKLPEVAHKLGAAWRALKRIQERVESEVREAIPDLPSTGDIARIARSPVNLLNQLADRVEAKESVDKPAPAAEPEVLSMNSAAEKAISAPEPGLTTPTQKVPPASSSSPADAPNDPSLN